MEDTVIAERVSSRPANYLIVGQRNLQNTLLASLLAKRLEARCTVASTSETLRQRQSGRTLALIDCDSLATEDLENTLSALCECAEVVALFNACDTTPYEWLLGLPRLKGLFYRDTSENQFLHGLKALANNEHWLPRKLLAAHLERTRQLGPRVPAEPIRLTGKEQAILRCLASGASNAEIARLLHNSPHTVKTHIHHLFRKLKVSNRVQAVSWAHGNVALLAGSGA